MQLLTGLGILFSGYINLGLDAISAYHWHMVVYLAWFSNLTHIACLTLLRGYLHQHQNERRWRLGLMLILWMLLLVAIGPTLWMNWTDDGSYPGGYPGLPSTNARCFFHPSVALKTIKWRECEHYYKDDEIAKCVDLGGHGDALSSSEAFQSAVTAIVLTVFTFFTRMAKIIQQWSTVIRRNVRPRLNKFDTSGILSLLQKPRIGWRARVWTSVLFLRVAVNLTARVYADLVSSELSDVSIFLRGMNNRRYTMILALTMCVSVRFTGCLFLRFGALCASLTCGSLSQSMKTRGNSGKYCLCSC